MDNDVLLKQIQNWTNNVPLLVIGSGASVPYGLPTMGALGDHLKSAISFLDKQDQDQFEEFKSYLNKFGDLEKALSDLNLGENVLNAIIGETWRLISNKDLSAYEGFICSGIQCPLSKL